ncbi:MAG TPA: GNAT family N-acetyltransferase [Chitinophagaceae bacterium]|nr:GNAT family N-acetyltransferase [Chitinophagaceae bacterium]
MDYQIERLSAQNIHHLVSLYRKAFGQVTSKSFLLKKYDTKAIGVDYVGFIAIANSGIVAAYYGVIPCNFQIDGETVVAAQSADTMTHPDFRKKGLFQLLAQKTYELARNLNIQFIFGFPNQDSYPGFVKLGWKFFPDQLQVFSMKTGTIAYGRLLRRLPFLSRLFDSIMNRVLGHDQVSPSFFDDELTIGLTHDETFCTYKTYHSTCIVSINGGSAWIRMDGALKVGALKGINRNNSLQFLKRLKSIASRWGCSEVTFITSKYSSLYNAIIETLTPRDAFPIGYLPLQYDHLSLERASFEYCDIDIF